MADHKKNRSRIVIETSSTRGQRGSRSLGRQSRTGPREGIVALSVIGAAALATFILPTLWHRWDSRHSLARSQAYKAYGAEFLDGGRSVPVGATESAVFREGSATLPGEATLFLYTDGLVERRDVSLDDRLAQLRAATSASYAGRCACQSVARWNAAAARRTVASPDARPTSARPTGIPATKPHGTLATGAPASVQGELNGIRASR